MACTELNGLIDHYVDGVLDEEMRARVERHLLLCAECAHDARSLEQTRAMLREACGPGAASPAFREKLGARLEDQLRDVLKPAGAGDAGIALQWPLPFPGEAGIPIQSPLPFSGRGE